MKACVDKATPSLPMWLIVRQHQVWMQAIGNRLVVDSKAVSLM
jgi:hypothetical protein